MTLLVSPVICRIISSIHRLSDRALAPASLGLALTLASACVGSYDPPPEPVANATSCAATCHGDATIAAPPRDMAGNTDTSVRTVGAHRSHVGESDWHKPVACSECHVVPASRDAPGHIDVAPAEVVFGPTSPGAGWNGETCTNAYCHGSALSGGTATEPVWTQVDGSQSACGSCHGLPPPAPHPANDDCGLCHQTMNPGSGLTIAYPAQHIDGTLDVIEGTPCDTCHGSGGSGAPPTDLDGNSDTAVTTVGAHRQHLNPSDWHKDMACSDCHRVPTSTSDAGHTDSDRPAELTFSALAGSATWNGTTCADSYCHGASLTGGTRTAPTWTQVDGTQSQCGSCHGAPPPAPHPANPDCGACHPTMTPGGGLVIAYPTLHIDGNLDVNSDQACDACHGSGGVAAPPTDTAGNTDTALRSVGAHRRHLGPSTWHKEMPCESCHVVPTAVDAVGHNDTATPAELTFSAFAGNAAWDGTSCSGAYCHGATLTGGATTAPVWTDVDGSQTQCDSCHGAPPPAPHPANDDCGVCHETMTPGSGLVIAIPERHIDGTLDVNDNAPCDSCHGSGGVAAPPSDVSGNVNTQFRGVGAHRSHIGTSNWHKEVQCSECHQVPATTATVGHNDTPLPAELTFGPLAGNATWNGATCSGSYCHGSALTGGNDPSPRWTIVDGSQAQCDSCHGAPPPPPHPVNPDCGACHDTMTPGGGLVIAVPARHIDGNLDVNNNAACDACHGSNGVSAPPIDTVGNTNTTSRGVGAHRSHLGASTWHKQIQCTECHLVPGAVTTIGHTDTPLPAELTFGALAGNATTWNGATCTNNYCHGDATTGGAATAPVWTTVDGSQSQCDSCHGLPPPPPHPADTACESCHGEVVGAGNVITTPALHIDGVLQVQSVHPVGWSNPVEHGMTFNAQGPASCATAACHGTALNGGASNVSCDSCHNNWKTTCTFCHGGTDNTTGAPPATIDGTVGRTDPLVGAHTEHVEATPMHASWNCTYCHTQPSSALSPAHVDGDLAAEVVFSALNPTAVYNQVGGTCSNLYCHGNGRANNGSGTWANNPTYNCQSCHNDTNGGQNLSGRHKKHIADENMSCDECHQDVLDANKNIIDVVLHVNGAKDVSMQVGGTWNAANQTCSGLPSGPCHGTKSW